MKIVSSVIHFAALKSVSDSLIKPLEYHDVNVKGTISLLQSNAMHRCKRFLFSSTAAVYGEPDFCPIDEIHKLNPLNPYAHLKLLLKIF